MFNIRLENFLSDNKLISINQNGFKKAHRTEDNIFILQSLYNRYVKTSNKKIYVAFIDFKKYFDLINRDFLYYKLQGMGITGNVYSLIKSMYSSCSYNIKCGAGLSDSILSTSGLKQGCNLSPNLSNIYQNDLHDIFDEACHPVQLDSRLFSSMSWADDLVLLSTSVSGLQNCLNNLHDYCYKWAIAINPEKTVCMTMSKGRTKNNEIFTPNGTELKNSKEIKYLGFHIKYNMDTKSMIEDGILKAKSH